jgi:ATP/maltotriose-dependent transcriptional regulator MalT
MVEVGDDPALVWSKLVAPAPRPGLITRAELQSLLQAGLEAKLCLVDAPAGFGRTTLLAQWRPLGLLPGSTNQTGTFHLDESKRWR